MMQSEYATVFGGQQSNQVQNKIEMLLDFEVLELLAAPAASSGRLRACGIRLVIDPGTRAALEALAGQGNEQAELLAANAFDPGHPEITRKSPKGSPHNGLLAKACAILRKRLCLD